MSHRQWWRHVYGGRARGDAAASIPTEEIMGIIGLLVVIILVILLLRLI